MSGFNAVLEESELQEGAMRAAAVDGVPVLVSRTEGGEACAIANIENWWNVVDWAEVERRYEVGHR